MNLKLKDNILIKTIEQKLKVKFNEKIEEGFGKISYQIDRGGNVKGINIENYKIENFDELILIMKDFTHLRNLVFYKNFIGDLSSIAILKNLTSLHIIENNISDISALKELSKLEYLSLNFNSISNISVLENLKKLKHLSIYDNKIEDISPIKKLLNLETLYIKNNAISDISALQNLVNLKGLLLYQNKIKDISPLKNLTKLKKLGLTENQIEIIPSWITDFDMDFTNNSVWKEGYIAIFNNPLKSPPLTVIEGGKKAIKNYFQQIEKEKGTEYLFEAKLLVIGEGGTGKTTFTLKIQDDTAAMPESKDTTLGIEVGKWTYPVSFPKLSNNDINFNVNLWDFGGQKIYQGTHQIFFSDNSFYVLIADTRDQKTDFSYWLNTVEQLGGDNSSLIIILNKKFGHDLKLDESGYRNHFGKLIKEFIELDLKNDKKLILELQEKIKLYLKQLPGIGDPLPPSWVSIRESLLIQKANFITFDQFREICKTHGIEESSMIYTLSGYYNRIGAFTHYIDDSLLQERIYLNSNWLVKTVYEVLDNKIAKSKKGRITENEIKEIWGSNELHYEINKLTQLMHRFGLMYKIPSSMDYVIPAHLPTLTPYNNWPYAATGDILHFIYEFDKYMPQGIMSRLIVALNHHISNHDYVWHRGVNIDSNGAYAEIIESYGGVNRFEIRIVGKNKIELLSIIRERFAEVLKPYSKLKYKQMVPCICNECETSKDPAFHDYNLLLKFRERKTGSQCSKTGEIINAESLLRITEKMPQIEFEEEVINQSKLKIIKMFLASSSELKTDREQFEIFINRENKILSKKNIFIELNVWEDFVDAMSKDSLQNEYNKVIIECNVFISLFFTKVGKYTAEEFDKAFNKFKESGAPYIYTFFKESTINIGEIKKDDLMSKLEFEEKLKKLNHFPTVYKNIDDLKYQFKMQLEKIFHNF